MSILKNSHVWTATLIMCMSVATFMGYFTSHVINEKVIEIVWYVGIAAMLLSLLKSFTDEISSSGLDRHVLITCMCGLPFAVGCRYASSGDLMGQLSELFYLGAAVCMMFCATLFALKLFFKYVLGMDGNEEDGTVKLQKALKIREKPGT